MCKNIYALYSNNQEPIGPNIYFECFIFYRIYKPTASSVQNFVTNNNEYKSL